MNKKSRDEALAHFGIKGMRWGVRNDDDNLGGAKYTPKKEKKPKSSSKITKEEYNAMLKKQPKGTKAQDAVAIAKNKEKFKAKFESTDGKTPSKSEPPKKKGWRPTKKQLAIAGIGAAYVGLVAASYYVDKQQNGPYLKNYSPQKSAADALKLKAMLATIKPGDKCTFDQYRKLIDQSISNSWGMKGYFNKYSYDRPELVFPAGHVFHRLSNGIEEHFGSRGNYCTTSKKELARYLASTEFGSKQTHVTWTAQTEIRVPQLSTVLETARLALSEYNGKEASATDAFAWYRSNTGGGWYLEGGINQRFFEMLKNQGYHAIVDEMDAGVYSETPLVWFEKTAASTKRSESVTKELLDESKSILTEIEHRK